MVGDLNLPHLIVVAVMVVVAAVVAFLGAQSIVVCLG